MLQRVSVPWIQMLQSLPFWGLVAVCPGNDFGFYTLLTELPTYLNDVQHYDLTSVSLGTKFYSSFMWAAVSRKGKRTIFSLINLIIFNLRTWLLTPTVQTHIFFIFSFPNFQNGILIVIVYRKSTFVYIFSPQRFLVIVYSKSTSLYICSLPSCTVSRSTSLYIFSFLIPRTASCQLFLIS